MQPPRGRGGALQSSRWHRRRDQGPRIANPSAVGTSIQARLTQLPRHVRARQCRPSLARFLAADARRTRATDQPDRRVVPAGDSARRRSATKVAMSFQGPGHLPPGRGSRCRCRSEPGDCRQPVSGGPPHPHPRSEPRGSALIMWPASVALEDGRDLLLGIITEESANAISLKRAEGATDAIARDQIETISSTGVSLMPEGLEKGLSPQDLANLDCVRSSIHSAPAATVPGAGFPREMRRSMRGPVGDGVAWHQADVRSSDFAVIRDRGPLTPATLSPSGRGRRPGAIAPL